MSITTPMRENSAISFELKCVWGGRGFQEKERLVCRERDAFNKTDDFALGVFPSRLRVSFMENLLFRQKLQT